MDGFPALSVILPMGFLKSHLFRYVFIQNLQKSYQLSEIGRQELARNWNSPVINISTARKGQTRRKKVMIMTYRSLSKDDFGKYVLSDTEVFTLPISIMKDPSEDSARIDNSFKTALEIVQRWKIEYSLFKLAGKLESLKESDVASISAMELVKSEIDSLKKLRDQLPADSEKPEDWYMYLACTIERPSFMKFTGADILIAAIKKAATDGDYKSVRDALLEFGKGFVPSADSGIKPKKPAFRLENPHDGRYSIEELVNACTARKSVITRKGASYKPVKDIDVLYQCLAELFRECYSIPVAEKKAKKPEYNRTI